MKRVGTILVTAVVLCGLAGGYWLMTEGRGPASQARGPGGPQGVVVEATEAIRATSVRKLKAIGTLTSNQ